MTATQQKECANEQERAKGGKPAPGFNDRFTSRLACLPNNGVSAIDNGSIPAHIATPRTTGNNTSPPPTDKPANPMKLVQIPPETIQFVWPLAEALLRPAIAYSHGELSVQKELLHVMAQRKQLWMVIDTENQQVRNKAVAAGITSLVLNADGSKTALIELFAGENMKQWFSLSGEFENWARLEGCKDIRIWARKGWARYLPDYSITHHVLRRELGAAA